MRRDRPRRFEKILRGATRLARSRRFAGFRSRCASGMCVVTSATVSPAPVRSMAKFSTPQRAAKNSVWPGNANPIFVHARLVNRPGHDRIDLAARAQVATASSSAPWAARALAGVGWPNECPSASPETAIIRLGQFARASAARTISGPMPAGIAQRDADAWCACHAQQSSAKHCQTTARRS